MVEFSASENIESATIKVSTQSSAETATPQPMLTSSEGKRSDFCYLPPDNSEETGISCRAYFPSWTFNANTGKCESYIYGGCGRTDNLFGTESDCERACVPVTGEARHARVQVATQSSIEETSTVRPSTAMAADDKRPSHCFLPPQIGTCPGRTIRKYYYDAEKNMCSLFMPKSCGVRLTYRLIKFRKFCNKFIFFYNSS